MDNNNKLHDFSTEFTFTSSRSSGPGGQNVNKLNTKVTLSFDVMSSNLLNDKEKELIMTKLANKINAQGILKISSQSERTQLANKERCIEKFYRQIKKSLKLKKKRKKTKPSQASIQKRLDDKKNQSDKKKSRKLDKGIL